MMFEIVPASLVASEAPEGLSALQFYRRDPVSEICRLAAVGDIAFSGRIANRLSPACFSETLGVLPDLLREADIVFGNLESPLLPQVDAGMQFASPVEAATTLRDAGFTMMHVANNHIYDYGADGLRSTLGALHDASIEALGAGSTSAEAGRIVRSDHHGLRIGWLGCGRTLKKQSATGPFYWEIDPTQLLGKVRKCHLEVDVLIVSIHIGLMYLDYPAPEHRQLAHELIGAGAQLVLMHHAHVLQGLEVFEAGQVVCYNLGNFLFDWEEGTVRANLVVNEQNEGAVFLFDLDRSGVCRAVALPTWIDEHCQVHWAVGRRGEKIIDRLTRISRDLQSGYRSQFQQQRAERNAGHAVAVFKHHMRHRNWTVVLNLLRQLGPRHLPLISRWVIGKAHSRWKQYRNG